MAAAKSKRAAKSKPKPAATPAPGKSKIDTLITLLKNAKGASLEALMKASGWQAHSVRGAMAGSIKKGRGLTITSEKIDGVRVYKVAP